ncbi:MAG: hypothetical protein ACT452_08680 [Microthrixaceae bacterium]
MSRTQRWTLAMIALGLSAAALAYLVTGSWWWAIGGLLGSGMVANALASARSVSQQGGRNP